MPKKLIQRLLIGLLLTVSTTSLVFGQDRYQYCKERASAATGYYGEVPDEYLPGGAIKGAMKGAAAGATLGWLGGKKKKKLGKAAKRGATLGLIIGGIKRGAAKVKQKKKRRAYEFEMRMCMSAQ